MGPSHAEREPKAARGCSGNFSVVAGPCTHNAKSGSHPALAISPFTAVSSSLVADDTGLFWTRYVNGADPAATTPLWLQLSADPTFSLIARQVATSTRADADFTAKVSVSDLPSGSSWYYRFTTLSGTEVSRTGRLRVAPSGSENATLSFGFSGCANGRYGPFPYLDWSGAANPGLDFFLMLGDNAYGNSINYPAPIGPSPEVGNPLDPELAPDAVATLLRQYHEKYRLNLTAIAPGSEASGTLASLYGAQGLYALFDNHDLQGDIFIEAGGAPRDLIRIAKENARKPDLNPTKDWSDLFESEGTKDAEFFSAATYFSQSGKVPEYVNQSPEFQGLIKAWRDYLPVVDPTAAREREGVYESRYYGAQQWGRNAVMIRLDDRSYRDVKILDGNNSGADDDTSKSQNKADSPDRTMLGSVQFAWLKQQLLDAKAKGTLWKFLAISSPIDATGAPGKDDAIEGAGTSVDAKSWWGNYRWERNELLRFIVDNDIRNVVFVTSDDHEFRVNEVVYSPDPSNLTDHLVAAPGVFTVVGSPIGAARPFGMIGSDLTPGQSFKPLVGSHFSEPLRLTRNGKTYDYQGGFQELASQFAQTMQEQGVDPVGLAADFPGLLSLERSTALFDDRPAYSADVNDPQPWDWWSPQTYNWVRFDLGSDGRLAVEAQGVAAYAPGSAFQSESRPAESIMRFTVAPSVRWRSPLRVSGGALAFDTDVSLATQRLDQGTGLATIGLRRGGEEMLLLRGAEAASAGSLSQELLFQADPRQDWRSSEGRAVGASAWSAGMGLASGTWQPVAWLNGQEQALQSLEVQANRAIASFSGGLTAQYALEATGTAAADGDRIRPLVSVRRLGAYDYSLAFYEVDGITGAVGGLLPGQSGYLQAALQEATAGGRLFEAGDLPGYGEEAELRDLVLRPDRHYGMLLLADGSRETIYSSFAAANPGATPRVLSLGSDNRGMVFGFEDLQEGSPLLDRDHNDLIVRVSSAVVLAG